MQTLNENKLRVLAILCENLKNTQPQVVGLERIANELQMKVGETRQLLLRMDEAGIIKSDVEGHYSLITSEGICWMNTMKNGVRA